MLGWILLGLLCATAVVVISGTIDDSSMKEVMKEEDMSNAVIKSIDRCSNTVKLEDLETGKVLEIQGDDVDYRLNERDRIYV